MKTSAWLQGRAAAAMAQGRLPWRGRPPGVARRARGAAATGAARRVWQRRPAAARRSSLTLCRAPARRGRDRQPSPGASGTGARLGPRPPHAARARATPRVAHAAVSLAGVAALESLETWRKPGARERGSRAGHRAGAHAARILSGAAPRPHSFPSLPQCPRRAGMADHTPGECARAAACGGGPGGGKTADALHPSPLPKPTTVTTPRPRATPRSPP